MQLNNNTASCDSTFFAQLLPGTAPTPGTASGTPNDGLPFEAVFTECTAPATVTTEAIEAAAALAGCLLLPAVPPPTTNVGLPDAQSGAEAEENAPDIAGDDGHDESTPPGWSRAVTSDRGLKGGWIEHAASEKFAAPASPATGAAASEANALVDAASPVPASGFTTERVRADARSDARMGFRPSPGTAVGAEAIPGTTMVPSGAARQMISAAELGATATPRTPGVLPGQPGWEPATDAASNPLEARPAVAALATPEFEIRDPGTSRSVNASATAAAEEGAGRTGDASRVSGGIAPAQAKFAARGSRDSGERSFRLQDRIKSFVTAESEEVETGDKLLGIDVAKTPETMASRFLSPSPHAATPEWVPGTAASVDRSPSDAAAATPAERATPAVSSAHEAVEVVLKAVSHAATREQRSVNLEIKVGDADLSVRVELQADQVRTTFRTESSDLRAALSHEWQSVAATVPAGERHVRVAPAIFTAPDHSTSNGSAGDSSSRQREQQAQREMTESSFASIRHLRPIAASSSNAAAPVAAVRNSQHLSTLA